MSLLMILIATTSLFSLRYCTYMCIPPEILSYTDCPCESHLPLISSICEVFLDCLNASASCSLPHRRMGSKRIPGWNEHASFGTGFGAKLAVPLVVSYSKSESIPTVAINMLFEE